MRQGILNTLLVLCLVASVAGQNGRRRVAPAVMAASESHKVIVTFLPAASGAALSATVASQGTIHLGNVSEAGAQGPGVELERRGEMLIVRSRFVLRLDSPAGPGATATLSSFLIYPAGQCQFYVDGALLTSAPQVIQRQVALGTLREHVLEVHIPITVPEGPIPNNLGFMALVD